MAAGQASTPRGATIHELAEDTSSRWHVLARRVLDDLEASDEGVRRLLDVGNATGIQIVVVALHKGWSRKRYSFRALAQAAHVTPHCVEKHLRAGLEALRTAPKPEMRPDALDLAWRRWTALERFISSPPGREDGGSVVETEDTFGSFRVDAAGTHWPAERWQPPGEYGEHYGKVTMPPQDADAGRDMLAKARRKAERRLKVDTLPALLVEGDTVEARPQSRCPAGLRAHLSDVHKGRSGRRPLTEMELGRR